MRGTPRRVTFLLLLLALSVLGALSSRGPSLDAQAPMAPRSSVPFEPDEGAPAA